MGFWDKLGENLGKAAQSGYKDLNNKMQRICDYERQYEQYDDRYLFNELKRSSGEKRMAITHILKKRGYGNQS